MGNLRKLVGSAFSTEVSARDTEEDFVTTNKRPLDVNLLLIISGSLWLVK